jgi:acyl carrier protein
MATIGEDQVALRSEQRLVRRLTSHKASFAPTKPMKIHPDRSYLITGGLRGIGLRVAEWLVQSGARHVALMGRNRADVRAEAAIERMRRVGAQILVIAGDVGTASDVQRAFSEIATTLPPLAGIIHSAGALDDAIISQQNWSRFAAVFKPKVSGTWLLHTLAPKLDFMVLFSSGASLAGSGGQANHSAANAFEDAMAWRRQAQGLPTVSINWGPWAEIGAAADRKLKTSGGLRSISPDDGLAALAFAMRVNEQTGLLDVSQVGVLNVESADQRSMAKHGDKTSAAAAVIVKNGAQPEVSGQSLRQRIAGAPQARRRNVLRDHIRLQAAVVLGLSRPEQIDINEPFGQLGLDSLMAIELRNRLAKAAERTFSATLTLDHPSVTALTEYLATAAFAEELGDEAPQSDDKHPEAGFDNMSADELALQLMQRLDGMAE